MSLELVEKVIIAPRFDISTWLVPCLNAIVHCKEMINFSEANWYGLGFEVGKSEGDAIVFYLHTLQLYGIHLVQ